jgi:hypothetical protein
MYADISRATFDPSALRLVQEQGRVLLDADANEQTAILLDRLHALARDLFGPFWGPAQVTGDPPKIDTGFRITVAGGKLTIGKGAYYASGVRAENWEDRDYTDQPYLNYDEGSDKIPADVDGYLVYLDVFEQFVPADVVPESADIAFALLGAAPRTQVVWQVRIKELAAEDVKSVLSAKEDNVEWLNLVDKFPVWMQDRKALPELAAAPIPGSDPDYPYLGENQLYRVEIHRNGIAAGSKTEDQIATFKWSRDNGAAVFRIAGLTPADTQYTVTLAETGRDERFSLSVGDWVEYVDDGVTRRPQRQPPEYAIRMFRVIEIDAYDPRQLTIEAPDGQNPPELRAFEAERAGFLRRWDYPQYPGAAASIPAADGSIAATLADDGALLVTSGFEVETWIALEDGARIRFQGNDENGDPAKYRRGDYWLIPARSASEAVIWPSADGTLPDDVPPQTPRHNYAPLAIFRAKPEKLFDCRPIADPTKILILLKAP